MAYLRDLLQTTRIYRLTNQGGSLMRISYNRLWKLLIDKKMNKSDLKAIAGISSTSVAKLGKGENITTDVLLRICEALDCDLPDIMEIERELAQEAE